MVNLKKPMVIEKILKQLTPERVKKEVEEVKKIKLPLEIKKLSNDYEKFGDLNRNEYLWQWIYRGTKIFTGKRIKKKYREPLLKAKVLIFMFDTFLDDIADKAKFRKKQLLEEILKVPFYQKYIEFKKLNKTDKERIKFVIRIWREINKTIRRFPRYREFKDVFRYDILQLLNTVRYSYLIQKNRSLLNVTEGWLYFPHSMQVLTNLTLELMCLPEFDVKETGKLRELGWKAQQMSRIGNWVSTWEREIEENDFTSGIFIYALNSGVIKVENLNKQNKSKIINKIKKAKIENKLLKEWEKNYWEIKKISKKIKSINVKEIPNTLKKIIFFHLSSKGYK